MKIFRVISYDAFFVKFFCLSYFSFASQLVCSKVSWDLVQKFFDFSSIPLEKQKTLKSNVEKLIELQLKLNNGQNLWEAFLYLCENCKGKFTFTFIFEVNDYFGADVFLDKYVIDTRCFCFKIRCNKIFSEKVFLDQEILTINMLHRPCLIKFNGKYHLREQKLPFFITLAHEFLHVLNQLERVQYIMDLKNKECVKKIILAKTNEELNDAIDRILKMQEFLIEKLNISKQSLCLKSKYAELWQNEQMEDSLEEMSVILGSFRNVDEKKNCFIGETTFLREYYEDPKIISCSHDNACVYEFFKTKMNVLLCQEYVNCVLETFQLQSVNLLDVTKIDKSGEVTLLEGPRSDIFRLNCKVEENLKKFEDKTADSTLKCN